MIEPEPVVDPKPADEEETQSEPEPVIEQKIEYQPEPEPVVQQKVEPEVIIEPKAEPKPVIKAPVTIAPKKVKISLKYDLRMNFKVCKAQMVSIIK